jgi:hypothetical protein
MKPINHNVKRWLIIAGICVAVILLLSVVFRGCLQVDTHKDEKKGVDQAAKALQLAYDKLKADSIAGAHREDSLQQVTDRQAAQLKAANQEINRSKQKILTIAAALDSAKDNRDTARFMALADSLKLESVAQQEVIIEQQQVTDSTIQNYEHRLAEKDKVIDAQAKFISQMRSAHLDLTDKYNDLHKDYGKVTRKLKGERTLGRILAGAALVAGGLFIAK